MAELNATIETTLKALLKTKKYPAAKDVLVTLNSVDVAVDLVEEMPANVVKRILAQADPGMRKDINALLRYPENSAGSIMTTEYVSLRPEMTVDEAIARIRKTAVDKETIYTCYVTENRRLLGVLPLKNLFLAKDDSLRISDGREQTRLRPRGDVEPVHHNGRRRALPPRLLRIRADASVILTEKERTVAVRSFFFCSAFFSEKRFTDPDAGRRRGKSARSRFPE